MARKVIYGMNVTLDGFIEGPGRNLDWAVIDGEYHRYINGRLSEAGAFLYGRRVYEAMAGYWPVAGFDSANPDYVIDFARIWKDMPKIVFSRTLEKAAANTRIIRENIAEEITKLKEQPGGDLMLGGAGIASAFFGLGLIDEIRIFIHPVIIGGGNPLFKDINERLNLKLVKSRTFKSGVIELDYLVEKK